MSARGNPCGVCARQSSSRVMVRRTVMPLSVRSASFSVSATDDAALFERLGLPVVVVRGSERAMKITDEEDFIRAEALFPVPE